MFLGDIIKKYREDKKISLDTFASKSGLSKSYIFMLEKNLNPTTGKPPAPTFKVIQACAKAMLIDVNELIDVLDNNQLITLNPKVIKRIPVLGRVAAGTPIEAIEDIIDYEEISEEMAKKGEYFALQIKGESMQPKFDNGDVVIVKKQEQVENGEIAIVLVNGNDATCKRIKRTEQGIMLIPNNPNYETMFYTNKDIKDLPIKIIGKVVELRAKF